MIMGPFPPIISHYNDRELCIVTVVASPVAVALTVVRWFLRVYSCLIDAVATLSARPLVNWRDNSIQAPQPFVPKVGRSSGCTGLCLFTSRRFIAVVPSPMLAKCTQLVYTVSQPLRVRSVPLVWDSLEQLRVVS